jgi:hypothetical protein
MRQHPSKIKVWEPILLFVVIVALIIYAVNAINAQDWLWFTSQATVIEPVEIVVVENGVRRTLVPGHAEFAQVSAAAKEALADIDSTDLINLGLSDETLDYFAENGVLLELYFREPVEFHTRFRAGEPTQILVPLAGRHAGNGYFFRGAEGEWWYGAIRMANPEPLYEALLGLGYPVAMRGG